MKIDASFSNFMSPTNCIGTHVGKRKTALHVAGKGTAEVESNEVARTAEEEAVSKETLPASQSIMCPQLGGTAEHGISSSPLL